MSVLNKPLSVLKSNHDDTVSTYLEAELPREVFGIVWRVPEEDHAREVVGDRLLQPEPR